MTRKQIVLGALILTGVLVIAAGFIPYTKTVTVEDIHAACARGYVQEEAVNSCVLRQYNRLVDQQRTDADKQVADSLK